MVIAEVTPLLQSSLHICRISSRAIGLGGVAMLV